MFCPQNDKLAFEKICSEDSINKLRKVNSELRVRLNRESAYSIVLHSTRCKSYLTLIFTGRAWRNPYHADTSRQRNIYGKYVGLHFTKENIPLAWFHSSFVLFPIQRDSLMDKMKTSHVENCNIIEVCYWAWPDLWVVEKCNNYWPLHFTIQHFEFCLIMCYLTLSAFYLVLSTKHQKYHYIHHLCKEGM